MTTCYGLLTNGRISDTAWTKEGLADKVRQRTGDEWALEDLSRYILEIDVPPIVEAVKWYFEKRGLLYAQDDIDAFLFLVSEIGETADAIVHARNNWVRNNERERNFGAEAGDSLMMLCVTAERRGVDPLEEMFAKFAKKGYPVHD